MSSAGYYSADHLWKYFEGRLQRLGIRISTKAYLWEFLLDQGRSLAQLDNTEGLDPLYSCWPVEHLQEPRVGCGCVLDEEQSAPGSLLAAGVYILAEVQEAVGVGGFGCMPECHSVFGR